MEKFIARENIKHYRDQLETEANPATRSRLHKLLVEEEDKLGASVELISEVGRQIARSKALIAERRPLIATMEREKHDGVGKAKALLEGLMHLHEECHQKLERQTR